jgi:hypothetical protein
LHLTNAHWRRLSYVAAEMIWWLRLFGRHARVLASKPQIPNAVAN